ncbi:hypothetical protein ACLOJK_038405 [Asimina triloba]
MRGCEEGGGQSLRSVSSFPIGGPLLRCRYSVTGDSNGACEGHLFEPSGRRRAVMVKGLYKLESRRKLCGIEDPRRNDVLKQQGHRPPSEGVKNSQQPPSCAVEESLEKQCPRLGSALRWGGLLADGADAVEILSGCMARAYGPRGEDSPHRWMCLLSRVPLHVLKEFLPVTLGRHHVNNLFGVSRIMDKEECRRIVATGKHPEEERVEEIVVGLLKDLDAVKLEQSRPRRLQRNYLQVRKIQRSSGMKRFEAIILAK